MKMPTMLAAVSVILCIFAKGGWIENETRFVEKKVYPPQGTKKPPHLLRDGSCNALLINP